MKTLSQKLKHSVQVIDRASELLENYLSEIYKQGNFLFCGILLLQWIAAIAVALITSPLTWKGAESSIHIHVWLALIMGGLLTVVPIIFTFKKPSAQLTRHIITVSQMLFSALLIHLSGGRIETHFHVFASLAFLSIYRDWKVLCTATIVVAADHLIRGIYWPESVYGVAYGNEWRILEHALWVVFENSALIYICRKAVSELRNISESQAMLESTKLIIEEQVVARTQDLLQAQESLKIARDEAIELSKVKSEFLANMSHEIRTPLNGVIGTLDIVMETPLDSEQEDLLRTGYNSAKSLLTIINDILDVSKIESGKFTLSPIALDIEKFLIDCERMMSPLIMERSITLVINKTANVPKYVYTDEVRLRQIIVNLIGNSVKFTKVGGGILMIVDAMTLEDNKVELNFSVSDCGRGIEKSKCDLIFEAFSQADNTIARKHGGTGLGLTISKAIVEMMGGKLWVRSKENVGSTFQFYVVAEIRDHAQTEKSEESHAKNYIANAKKSHILLAEDNLVNQKITVKLLEKKGFTVIVVGNGELALQALEKSKFDLVLMDVQMPVMDGIEAIKLIRNSEKDWAKIPIIALTAHALQGDKENLLSIGANSYVSKPIDKNQFFLEIANFTQS